MLFQVFKTLIEERSLDDLICTAEMETEIENKHMDIKGEGVGGGMSWEIVIDIYTLLIPCMKQITSGNLV